MSMGFAFFLLVFLFQAFPVKSFLLNTDKPPLLNPTTGYDANIIAYFFQKVDYLQLQIQQQNKTMETQATMIQQHLNITQQSPSTASLSNDLSILQMYVRRIMDEYHRLSNISDATDLALKINSMANSVRILTTSLTSQSNLINQLENQHQRMEENLNRIMNLTNGNDNKLTSMSSEIQSAKNTLSSLQSTVAQNQRDVTNQISTMSTQNQNNLAALSNDVHSAQSSISSMQNVSSQNQNSITSLTRQYSSLSISLSTLQTRITSMDTREHNLESKFMGKYYKCSTFI